MAEVSVRDPDPPFPVAGKRRLTLAIPPPPPEDGMEGNPTPLPEDTPPPMNGPNLVTMAIMSYGVHISTSRSSSISSPVDELSPVPSFTNLSESGQSEVSSRSNSFTGQGQGQNQIGSDGNEGVITSDEDRDTLGVGGSPHGGRRLPSLNSSSPSVKRSSNLNPSPTGSPCISPVPSTHSLHGETGAGAGAAGGVCSADLGVTRRHGGVTAGGSKRLSALNPNSGGSVNGTGDSPSTDELSSPESGSPVQSPGATACPTPTSPNSAPGSPKTALNHVTVNLWKNQPGVEAVIGSMEKHEIQRQELMQEIIVSEASYVKDLETTKRLFHFPLNKFKVITSEESADIFGDINKLIKINSELLKDLKTRQKEQWPVVDDVSDILLPFFNNIYANYHRQCESIRSSSAKVVDLIKTNTGFASFMSTLTKNEGVDVLGLNSYLIKPLQRVTKYALLMRELKKFTPETHHSYARVCECFETIEKAVGEINEFTRSSEQQTQLFELQQKLDMSELPTPVTIPQQGRTLLKEGLIKVELYSSGGKDSGRKEFYGFLFNDMLLLTKKRKRTAADDKKMTKLLQATRRGSSSDIGTPPSSPVLGVIYKVMTEPLYLVAAERHSQETKVVFEFFSSYAMTMYVIEVPLVPSPADDPHPNETWCPEVIRAVNTQKGPETVMSEDKNEGADSGEGSANKPKVNMVQANLWKNQPGAREIAGTLEKNEVQRQECMHELYLSEVAYVKDLNSTIVLFYRPLQKFQILPSDVVEDIFGDIPKLHRLNKRFLEDLEEKKKEQWPVYTDVSDVLLPFFGSIYANYCNHCQKTKACSARVVELLESNKMFADFMSTLTKNEGVDVLGLNSYLIKPLQRITKYNLLLRELLRYTPPDHPSYAGVTKAYELVGKALTDINEYQRQSEFKEQLFDIQSHLEALPDGDPVVVYSPGRHVCAEGPCHVDVMVKRKVKKTVKEGYCFVFNDAILFTKRKPAKDSSSKLKRMSMGTSLKRQSNSMGNSQDHQGYMYKVIGQVFLHKDAIITTTEKGLVYEYPEAGAPNNTYGLRIVPGDDDLPNNTLADAVARAVADAKQPVA
eukprot:comp23839_c0_seq1/m.41616 comp23839_c0_seq1/g.41616  ORF comp23839_c0_seq1/g.41616 comp23839_c0_seq1/m.41616 type:complete len:1077 (-) comp23839_c0_seq1:287-3517(-)